VRGELVLHPFNAGGVDLRELSLPLTVRVGDREMSLVAARPTADAWLVRLEGVDDRDAAAALTNVDLTLARAALPEPDDGEVYVEDLVGCEVRDVEGRRRGVVRATFWNGAQDVLSIVDDAGVELLVPAVPEFLRELDLEARTVIVDPHE
jgi:16S rRNA processing protein RimM